MGKSLFVKVPVIIEAEQWFSGVRVDGVIEEDRKVGGFYVHAWIDTVQGPREVRSGDWIITGSDGKKYPCDQELFVNSYDRYVPTISVIKQPE